MRKLIFVGLIIGIFWVIYQKITYSHLSPDVIAKKHRLDKALLKKGFRTDYWIISGYRPSWLNKLLPLSAKKSVHQQGLAIDLWVWDIDGDKKWTNRDVNLVADELVRLDKQDPVHQGGVGLYRKTVKRMVHFDVSKKHRRWY